jgi:hypothetical protein
MRTTAQLHVLDRRRAAVGKRHNVVIFEESTLMASTVSANECAPSIIPRQTARRTAAGMWRDFTADVVLSRRQVVAPHFIRFSSFSSIVNARSKITAGSPFGS